MRRMPFEQKLEFLIHAENASLGWAYLVVTEDGVIGPKMLNQTLLAKWHSASALQTFVQQSYLELSRSIDYAVDIFIYPELLNLSTLTQDPESESFHFATFINHSDAYMILANGRCRIQCTKQLLAQHLHEEWSGGLPWLARFYDLSKIIQ